MPGYIRRGYATCSRLLNAVHFDIQPNSGHLGGANNIGLVINTNLYLNMNLKLSLGLISVGLELKVPLWGTDGPSTIVVHEVGSSNAHPSDTGSNQALIINFESIQKLDNASLEPNRSEHVPGVLFSWTTTCASFIAQHTPLNMGRKAIPRRAIDATPAPPPFPTAFPTELEREIFESATLRHPPICYA
ncbi:hypothetical protein C8R44DRAFT_745361 [Mycena epipterygia]|nr:hypothetical protein C8R44DRAFT_745361 [Mycena epipterygia]